MMRKKKSVKHLPRAKTKWRVACGFSMYDFALCDTLYPPTAGLSDWPNLLETKMEQTTRSGIPGAFCATKQVLLRRSIIRPLYAAV